jgi:hypothetical protein
MHCGRRHRPAEAICSNISSGDAEAASGLRLNISNDGWHAVDLWEKKQQYVCIPRCLGCQQPDPLQEALNTEAVFSIVGRRDATTWKEV